MKHASKHIRAVAIVLAGAVLATASACAGSKAKTGSGSHEGNTEVTVSPPGATQKAEDKAVIGGTMTSEMTTADALLVVRSQQEAFDACYESEALNGNIENAAVVFEVSIPENGNETPPAVRHRTHPEKVALEHCLQEAMDKLDFPAHRGEQLTLQVRIQGRTPPSAGAPIALIEDASAVAQSSQTVR
jgi:hypothetical protein